MAFKSLTSEMKAPYKIYRALVERFQNKKCIKHPEKVYRTISNLSRQNIPIKTAFVLKRLPIHSARSILFEEGVLVPRLFFPKGVAD